MPFSLSDPTLIREFFLIQPPEDTLPAYVHIRKMTVLAETERTALLQSDLWQEGEANLRKSSSLTIEEIHIKEVYYSLADCNFCEEDGSFLFRFKNQFLDMTENEFQLAWGRLPTEYQKQIIDLVHAVNPIWLLQDVKHA
jgi:hypothetical protein